MLILKSVEFVNILLELLLGLVVVLVFLCFREIVLLVHVLAPLNFGVRYFELRIGLLLKGLHGLFFGLNIPLGLSGDFLMALNALVVLLVVVLADHLVILLKTALKILLGAEIIGNIGVKALVGVVEVVIVFQRVEGFVFIFLNQPLFEFVEVFNDLLVVGHDLF